MPTTILPVAMPVGTLDGPANDFSPLSGPDSHNSVTFTLLPGGGRSPVTPGDYITVANHDPRIPASACFRGRVTEFSGPTCAFVLEGSRVGPEWPAHISPLGQGNAVYLALPDSFIPNPARIVRNQADWDMLLGLAADHQARTGIPPAAAIIELQSTVHWDSIPAPRNQQDDQPQDDE